MVALGLRLRKDTLDDVFSNDKLLRNCVDFLRGEENEACGRRWDSVATPLIDRIAVDFRYRLPDDAIEYLRHFSNKVPRTVVHSCAGTDADQSRTVVMAIQTAARQVPLPAEEPTSVVVLTDIPVKKNALLGDATARITIGESAFSVRALVLSFPGHYRWVPSNC